MRSEISSKYPTSFVQLHISNFSHRKNLVIMKSSFIIIRIAKYLVILILVTSFILSLFWLWQRQPKSKPQEKSETPTIEDKTATSGQFKISPQDNTVLTSSKAKFEGKTVPNALTAIFSNNLQEIIKAEESGTFSKEVQLTDGLNLIQITVILPEPKQNQQKNLTLYVAKDHSNGQTVFAGPVKTIIDPLITISTDSGQKVVKTTNATAITLPTANDEEGATGSAIRNIRVGDYLIALGDSSESAEEVTAKKIEVVRENKPQIVQKLTQVKILTAPRQNLFSAKITETNEIIEFNLTSNSRISLADGQGKSADIVKEKNAIIIYHLKDDKNLPDLIYLLP